MNIDWIHWHPEPGVLDGLVVVSVLYLLAVGPLRRHLASDEPYPKAQALWFFSGVLTMFAAVGSPLDEIGERYLFSAHMLQHVILIYIVPVQLLLGVPSWLLKPFLVMEWSGPLIRFFTRPIPAFLVFNGLFVIWHIPGLYEWALRDPQIHFLEHATFIGASILMWWPLLHTVENPLHYGNRLLYLLALAIGQLPLFGFLTFSSKVYYPTYLHAERITSLTPLEDQVLGGVIMKIAAMIAMFTTLVYIFMQWYYVEGPRSNSRPSASR